LNYQTGEVSVALDSEARVLLTRDAAQCEELAKRHERALLVLFRETRQFAGAQVAKERERQVSVERGVNPVVAVVADAAVAGRRAVAASKQCLGRVQHLGQVVAHGARVARTTRQEVVEVELRLVNGSRQGGTR
jgi:hypothetical protein